MQITEVKRHVDGRTERFRCELLLRRRHVAVLRFDHERERSAGGFLFPSGSRSFGFFWPRRNYLLYRMTGADGQLIAHRYDIVEDVRLGEQELSYTDLLLDAWVDPSGRLRFEDEEELADQRRRGVISSLQLTRIDRARDVLVRRHRLIEREALRLLEAAQSA